MSLVLLKATGHRSTEAAEHLVQAPCGAPGWGDVLRVGAVSWPRAPCLCPKTLRVEVELFYTTL